MFKYKSQRVNQICVNNFNINILVIDQNVYNMKKTLYAKTKFWDFEHRSEIKIGALFKSVIK